MQLLSNDLITWGSGVEGVRYASALQFGGSAGIQIP